MYLSQLIGKSIRVGKNLRGVCVGLGISLKSKAVKYLLCTSQTATHEKYTTADFAVSIHAIERISNDEICLSALRAVIPKACGKLFLDKPIYSEEGIYLGQLTDVEIKNFNALKVFTDQNTAYSLFTMSACSDVVILRKEQPFPLGQRIPAPSSFDFLRKNERVVTKPVLRSAIKNGKMLRLTLALPPFQFEPVLGNNNEEAL